MHAYWNAASAAMPHVGGQPMAKRGGVSVPVLDAQNERVDRQLFDEEVVAAQSQNQPVEGANSFRHSANVRAELGRHSNGREGAVERDDAVAVDVKSVSHGDLRGSVAADISARK
eukprot:CAMPEP_0180049096 /NCGR_PEP_ID=MMETSP0984-20121128/38642_1 /TAXON_ID=483367 /ORGANISM="non described non described, Strain CCMP 2436" /LENGTH=114 /DNA_ID=CAMNT_0021978043 /DNA_START=318 /DNA_END=662 /DNA_ORIENTATION=+